MPDLYSSPAEPSARPTVQLSPTFPANVLTSNRTLAGVAFGLIAYGMWGFFPLYFHQLTHVPPLDVLCNRAVWGCLFVSLLLTLRQRWKAHWSWFAQLTRNQLLQAGDPVAREGQTRWAGQIGLIYFQR